MIYYFKAKSACFVLIKVKMISLKYMKQLANFFEWRKFYAQIVNPRQAGFTYSACGPFVIHRKKIKKFEETGYLNYTYKKELDKVCFARDVGYSDSKDLAKRTVSNKDLKNKSF